MSHHHDAELILQFYELRREARLRDARSFVLGRFKASTVKEFNDLCPPGSEENAYVRQVVSYWDMVCAIVSRHLVDKELFFETNGELTVVWEKIKTVLPELRESFNNPMFLRNVEAIAKEREAYLQQHSPGYLEALRERLGMT